MGLAGDAPQRRKVGGALAIWVGGQPCALPSDRGNMALLRAPGPPLASFVPVCGVWVLTLFALQSQRGWSSSAFVPPHSSFTEAVMSLPVLDVWAVGLDPYVAGTAGTSTAHTVTGT